MLGICANRLIRPNRVQPARQSLLHIELRVRTARNTITPDDRPRIAIFRMTIGLGNEDRVMSIWPRIRIAVTLTLALIVKATANEQVFESDVAESTHSTLLMLPIRRLTGTLIARVMALVPVFGQKVDIRIAGGATLGNRVIGNTPNAINLVIMTTNVSIAVNTG